MKERGKRLLLLFSVLIVMILAAVSANAEEAAFIQTGSRPTVIKDSAGSVAKAVSRPQITSLYNSNNGVGIKLKKQSGVLYYDFYRYEAGKAPNISVGVTVPRRILLTPPPNPDGENPTYIPFMRLTTITVQAV